MITMVNVMHVKHSIAFNLTHLKLLLLSFMVICFLKILWLFGLKLKGLSSSESYTKFNQILNFINTTLFNIIQTLYMIHRYDFINFLIKYF